METVDCGCTAFPSDSTCLLPTETLWFASAARANGFGLALQRVQGQPGQGDDLSGRGLKTPKLVSVVFSSLFLPPEFITVLPGLT